MATAFSEMARRSALSRSREGSDQHGRIDGAYDRKERGEGGESGFEHVINERALLLGPCP